MTKAPPRGKEPNRPERRRFLKTSGAAVAAAVAPTTSVALSTGETTAQPSRGRTLDLPILRALAEVILPGEIGADGVDDALRNFVRWLDGFEPVANLPHPYLSSDEVRFGPADPAPMWASQLDALDLLAQKRFGNDFAALPTENRRAIAEGAMDRHIPADGALPSPAYATHVAVGLLAHFYSRPATADLAYGARINAAACRDLASGAEAPPALTTETNGGNN